jgi:nucleoside-diphosphate-sugar epimerase
LRTLSIIGCGWLGLPLAQNLIKNGFQIIGTTTTLEKVNSLSKLGIHAVKYTLGDELPKEIIKSEAIIITIPPRGIDYMANLEKLQNELSGYNKQLIFISSTSVYSDTGREVFEHDAIDIPSSHTGISLLRAENLFVNSSLNTTVVRFSGLFGPERNPGRFLAGKKNLTGSNNPVNLIHLDDCIGIISKIIELGITNDIFNGCAPIHPSRKEFYTKAANLLGMDPLEFSEMDSSYKIVDSSKVQKLLNYEFKYANPLDGLTLI